MRSRYPRLFLALVGASSGLLFGIIYWFAWACRKCQRGESPMAVLAFCSVTGTAMALLWGKDHLAAPTTDVERASLPLQSPSSNEP